MTTVTKKRPDYRRDPKVPEPLKVQEFDVCQANISPYSVQSRVSENQEAIADYADILREGRKFKDRVKLFTWGEDMSPKAVYYIGDGFHRVAAYQFADADMLIEAEVHFFKSEEDAKIAAEWCAITSNTDHGVRRSTEDKRRAVKLAIQQQPRLNDSRIAALVCVDHKTVARVRAALEGKPDPYKPIQGDLSPEEKPERKGREEAEERYDKDIADIQEKARERLKELAPVRGNYRVMLSPVIAAAEELVRAAVETDMQFQPETSDLVLMAQAFLDLCKES